MVGPKKLVLKTFSWKQTLVYGALFLGLNLALRQPTQSKNAYENMDTGLSLKGKITTAIQDMNNDEQADLVVTGVNDYWLSRVLVYSMKGDALYKVMDSGVYDANDIRAGDSGCFSGSLEMCIQDMDDNGFPDIVLAGKKPQKGISSFSTSNGHDYMAEVYMIRNLGDEKYEHPIRIGSVSGLSGNLIVRAIDGNLKPYPDIIVGGVSFDGKSSDKIHIFEYDGKGSYELITRD